MRFAVLIDAGFAKTKLGTSETPATAKDFTGLVKQISQHPFLSDKYLYRVYYYDAPPYAKSRNMPLNGGKYSFAKARLTIHNRKLLAELAKEDYFALRMGEVRFRGWELKRNILPTDSSRCEITSEYLRPSLQQKGVDMRIGLDIASLSLKQQVDIIVLVTGDSDFVPPMKFARKEGLQLALVTFDHSVHTDLFEHADLFLDIKAAATD
ncbi:NYN domain-containing protein [Porticoccus sp. W117]|uniref:NYN domain-containing protein n=1 Tax=Porticoccus sp. W117 TaxID=3054777 RepID=UPI002598D109|nr:NYN domain-containing protein [Porticoccus sp. W117]MDM3869890.1 NYN domain-containing protein [Porticoccus sp. W117]